MKIFLKDNKKDIHQICNIKEFALTRTKLMYNKRKKVQATCDIIMVQFLPKSF